MKRLFFTSILLTVSFCLLCAFAGQQGGTTTQSLHDAARKGDISQLQLLISNNADVNQKDSAGYTPLFYAAEKGHAEAAQHLLSAGANVNATDNIGNTPLHYAAFYGHYNMCQLLLDSGANIDAKNTSGGTPLAMAKAAGRNQIVELLSNRSTTATGSNTSGLLPAIKEQTTMQYENLGETKMSSAAETISITKLLADPNKIKVALKKYEGLENEIEQLERKSDAESRQWLQQRTDNRVNLAREVHDQITAELLLIRKLAAQEGAKRTTAAIDGLLLNRQNRLEKLIEKLDEERKDLRQLRNTRTRYPTRQRYPQDRQPYEQ